MVLLTVSNTKGSRVERGDGDRVEQASRVTESNWQIRSARETYIVHCRKMGRHDPKWSGEKRTPRNREGAPSRGAIPRRKIRPLV